ncbi:hypothetical protein HPB47_011362 [Ixodes persulcatus]|uniref:Uncharacterized protein n=1 Tax=Ixodes persulcatus TaxID=34615 RepID=A0AC60NWI3_IXOPE|nr:hypothetical protein HPB47_011362 [Ixodes persulcatus]
MAADDHGPVEALSHRMVGFSDALDWRPLLFVEPVIAERACALCDVVCGTAVRLSCAHTLCPDCYAECVEQGRICPLDQEPFSEDDLLRLDCSASYLGKRRRLEGVDYGFQSASSTGVLTVSSTAVPRFPPDDVVGVSCCWLPQSWSGGGTSTMRPDGRRKTKQTRDGMPRRQRHLVAAHLFHQDRDVQQRFTPAPATRFIAVQDYFLCVGGIGCKCKCTSQRYVPSTVMQTHINGDAAVTVIPRCKVGLSGQLRTGLHLPGQWVALDASNYRRKDKSVKDASEHFGLCLDYAPYDGLQQTPSAIGAQAMHNVWGVKSHDTFTSYLAQSIRCNSLKATNTVAKNCQSREPDSIQQARDELKEALGKVSEELISLQSGLNQCREDIRATRATGTSCQHLLESQALRLNALNALCTSSFTEERRTVEKVAADVAAMKLSSSLCFALELPRRLISVWLFPSPQQLGMSINPNVQLGID